MRWSPDEIETLSTRFGVFDDEPYHYHFPQASFLADGYHPPGGYVKDFCVYRHDRHLHLFHIDGRPGEICWITGNEIHFGHASTDDFHRWVRHRMPLSVGERPWEQEHVYAPFVYAWKDTYYMFYMGSGNGEAYISYATSSDLERWERWPNGPIRQARGRDPFVFDYQGRKVLVYTASGGPRPGARLGACTSDNLREWQAIDDVITLPDRLAAESASIHAAPKGRSLGPYILWFNDFAAHGRGLRDFHACYAFGHDPVRFDAGEVRRFAFDAPNARDVPLEYGPSEPCPVAIEQVYGGRDAWLVAYFRMHIDRFRLFFGLLDWATEPLTIREINSDDQLKRALGQVGRT